MKFFKKTQSMQEYSKYSKILFRVFMCTDLRYKNLFNTFAFETLFSLNEYLINIFGH